MNETWIPITERLPEPGRYVWCYRQWLSRAARRSDVVLSFRDGGELYTGDDPTDGIHWNSVNREPGASWSDITVTHWAEITPPEASPNESGSGGSEEPPPSHNQKEAGE